MRGVVVVTRQANLFEIVATLHIPGRLAAGLDGGQQECDENADDRNHDQ